MLYIERLELWQFRNFTQVQWNGLNQINLIVGQNGQGKSNLLEGIYYLSHGRSNRSSRDTELIRHARGGLLDPSVEDPFLGQGSRVALHLAGGFSLEARFQPDKVTSPTGFVSQKWKTQFLIDSQRCKSRSEIIGRLPSVSFYLSDLEIVRGMPQSRRRWVDLATVQRKPLHLEHLQVWKKTLSEKSALLKQMDFPSPQSEQVHLLDVLNQQLATVAWRILSERLETLGILQTHLPKLYQELSQGHDGTPTLSYTVHNWPDALTLLETLNEHEWIQACLLHLREIMPQELRRQSVVWGVHRDDIGIHFVENDQKVDVTTYASQGQQRSVVIALKLAELAMLESSLGKSPIILLDDIMAELDADRQRQLLHIFPQTSQVFLTTPYVDTHHHFHSLLAEKKSSLSSWQVASGEIRLL
jgi:DNA replication and repair protein RecF